MREAGRYEPCTSRFLEDFLSWKRLVNLLLDGSVVKNQPANAGDTRGVGSISGFGRYPGGGHGNPLQYSSLENPMDRGAWQDTVHHKESYMTEWLNTQ